MTAPAKPDPLGVECEADHYEDKPCTKDVAPVHVTMPGGHDWGLFWYCSEGIAEDTKRGFSVRRVTLDEAAEIEDAERKAYHAARVKRAEEEGRK